MFRPPPEWWTSAAMEGLSVLCCLFNNNLFYALAVDVSEDDILGADEGGNVG